MRAIVQDVLLDTDRAEYICDLARLLRRPLPESELLYYDEKNDRFFTRRFVPAVSKWYLSPICFSEFVDLVQKAIAIYH